MTDFTSKVAVVTGAASGIGLATVQELLARGASVVALDLDASAARASIEVAGDSRGLALGCDVRDPVACERSIAAAVETFGRLDIVVNSAGVIRYGTVEQIALEDWRLQLDTNLGGVFYICRAAIPHLRSARAGAIVNVASTQAFATQPEVAAYTASKAAVVAITRTMAVDHASDGIRVNAVGPGSVDTAMLRYAAHIFSPDDPDAAVDAWGASHPLGRVITPEEVARVIIFLASDEASGVTGATYMVDGGATARLST